MPHLVILYTGQLDAETNMKVLCRDLADAMLTVVDEAGKQVFPTGGRACWPIPRLTMPWPMGAQQAARLRNLTITHMAARKITRLCI